MAARLAEGMNMFLAERFRAHRILSLGFAGTLIASASLVAASPVPAVVPTISGPSSDPHGMVDSATTAPGAVTARGWAIDPDTSGPIMVQMYVDGRANALTWASQPRPDVGAVFPAAGPSHGYTLTMPAAAGAHTVCLYGINTGPGISRQIGCRTVTVPSHDPFGVIDAVTSGVGQVTARGWAIDPDTSGPIMVQMYVDGRANALTWASQPRPDVGAVFPAAGPSHGYTLTMPATAGAHTVCLYGINTGPGISRQLGCRAVNSGGSAAPAPAALLLDYQTGNFSQWNAQQLYRTAQQAIVSTPAHTPYTNTARFIVAPGDYTNGGTAAERSEVMASVAQTGNPAQGQTMWFAWSTFIPAGTQVDSNAASPVGNGWLIFTQWHGSGSSGNPDIAFGLSKGSATPHLIIDTQGGAGPSTTQEWLQPNPIPLGVWNDFVVGVVWGTSPATGRLTVKMNGATLVANAPCSNLFTGLSAYLKQGIYRAASHRTTTIYDTATRRGLTEASVAR
jgi:hypothetical protein